MSNWQLKLQFLKSDMQTLDSPHNFVKNFKCQHLLKFFKQITTLRQVSEKKAQINLFFDRFLNFSENYKTTYIQMKWIVFVHQIIQNLKQNSPLFQYFMKAIQVCLQFVSSYQRHQGIYQQYLIKFLIKPYLQYLYKICLLNNSQETPKLSNGSGHILQTKPQSEQNFPNGKKQDEDFDELVNQKLIDWYRKYNFVSSTIQIFQPILKQTQKFFSTIMPYLSTIGEKILKDLNTWIFKLKYHYRSLKRLNVTTIQLDQLETKIKLFSKDHTNYFQNLTQSGSIKMPDFTNQDLKQFLQSPLKMRQTKLSAKRSLLTPTNLCLEN